MNWTKDYHTRCDICGKFCILYDEETPYGTKDYEEPEPLDPYHYCKKCSKENYQNWLKQFKSGSRYGDWRKSDAENKAARKMNLVWDNSNFKYKKITNLTKQRS